MQFRLPTELRAPLLIIALLSFGFAGCTSNGGERVPDWPALQIVEHYVPHHQMRARCAKYVPPLMSPEACAEFDFANRLCHVWFSADFPPAPYIVRHEREHCLGYEHAGEHGLRAMLARHQARLLAANASQGASAPDPARPDKK